MRIRWNRTLGLGLFVGALVFAIAYRESVLQAVSMVGNLGPGHSPDEQFKGALILGLLLVTLVALTRILTSDSRTASDGSRRDRDANP